MTKTVSIREMTRHYITREYRSRLLLQRLLKAIALLLAVAFCLSVMLELFKGVPFLYTVEETTVTVTAGDTLWQIASEHIGEYPGGIRSYLAEICRRNGLTGIDTIHAGTVLTLPIYSYLLS